MKIHLIFGGPGTGKTARLGELYRQCLKVYDASEVRFVSFTRSQVNRDRTAVRKALKLKGGKSVAGFTTLHSAAAKSYGKGEDGRSNCDVFEADELHDIGDFLGVSMTAVMVGYNYMRSTDTTDMAVGANKAGLSTKEFEKCVYFYEQVKKLKSDKRKKIDFSDMLGNAIKTGFCFEDCKVAFVDEAQDLSALQWQTVYTLFKRAEVMYVAGDPNQAIYGFAGGLPNYMNEMRYDEIEYLEYSHRCSKAVMEAASLVASHIDRGTKPPKPNANGNGFAVYCPTKDLHGSWFDCLAPMMTHGKTALFLAFTYDHLSKIEDALFYPNGKQYDDEGKLKVPYKYTFLSGRAKTISKRNKKITLATIHQAKGMEADYVFIDVCWGRGHLHGWEFKDFLKYQEEYNKMMYVAITRARVGVVFFEMTSQTVAEPKLTDLRYCNVGREFYDLLVKHKLNKRRAEKAARAARQDSTS